MENCPQEAERGRRSGGMSTGRGRSGRGPGAGCSMTALPASSMAEKPPRAHTAWGTDTPETFMEGTGCWELVLQGENSQEAGGAWEVTPGSAGSCLRSGVKGTRLRSRGMWQARGREHQASPPAPRHRGNAAGGDPMALRADGEAKRPGAHGHHPRRRPERTALRPTASVTCWAGVLWAPLGNGGGYG